MASDILPPSKREKVVLKPGFGLTDWMRLTNSGADLSGRNGKGLRQLTLEEVSQHNLPYDCWTIYNNKVYNITQYMHYHPGGIPIIMKGAGQDCTTLFNKYHRWVNLEAMLSKCLVGTIVLDSPKINEEDEDETVDEILDDSKKSEVKDEVPLEEKVAKMLNCTTEDDIEDTEDNEARVKDINIFTDKK
jgi:cytochrome-b5 reductase